MLRFLLFILLFSPSLLFGQSALNQLALKGKDAVVFYDQKNHSFIVIEDSSTYNAYNKEEKKWEKHNYIYDADIPFKDFLGYVPLTSEKTDPYFIAPGCGIVLKWHQNRIIRIDNSFNHLNQLAGTFFMYNGRPHIFGGYGLFTYKNIVTYFDKQSSEWFLLQVKGNKPPLVQMTNGKIENDILYIFNGFNMNNELKMKKLRGVYTLNLKTNSWSRLGDLNPKILLSTLEANEKRQFDLLKNDFVVFENRIIRYNFELNKYESYGLNSKNSLKLILESDGLYLIKYRNTGSNEYFINIENNSFLKSLKKSSGWIYKSTNGRDTFFNSWFIIILGAVLLFITTLFVKRRKNASRDTGVETKKGNTEFDFNENEQLLYDLFVYKGLDGLELSEINDLVNFGSPNIDTLKKRRELLLKDFKQKLAYQYKLSVDEVITEQRFSQDKRIKKLILNELIYKNTHRD
mgnify:FL=1